MAEQHVRFRSNVAVRQDHESTDLRRLIPGEIAADTISLIDLTDMQRSERQLYAGCTGCKRALQTIARQGCSRNACDGVERASRLQGPLQLHRASAALGPISRFAVPDPGRGAIEPIPEWQPGERGRG